MKIVKCLMLRSSMIGLGLIVGGLALAVWHFSGNSQTTADQQRAGKDAGSQQVGSGKSPGMVPVKDLDPAPIQPPGKEVFDRGFSATKSSLDTVTTADPPSPPSPSTFAFSDQYSTPVSSEPLNSDFPVDKTGDGTALKNPAAVDEFVLPPPTSLTTDQLVESAPFDSNSRTPLAATEAGSPSPANLSAPNGFEALPLLPSPAGIVNDHNTFSRAPPATTNQVVSGVPAGSSITTNPAGLAPLSGPSPTLSQPTVGTLAGNAALDLTRPGDAQFDGQQAPQLTIEKRAPAEIQVNQLATFEIKIRNTGQVSAHQVRVRDFVPQGTKLERASPAAVPAADGSLVWNLGTLQPGQETTISMQLLPLQEGQLGSVATVDFQARASVRTTCTKPQLMVKQSAPEKVLIGKDITVSITVSNSGSGDAISVVLVEDVPEQLTHAAGRELEYPIGTLRPGETKQLSLTMRGSKAGLVRNVLALKGVGKVYVEDVVQFEVIAPQLQVALEGPKVRYLNRPAKYSVTVANPGTAPANNIELVVYLPKGLKFVETDHHGRYDANHHAVLWSLEELPANARDSVSVTALPIEAGEQRLRLEGRASLGLSHQYDHLVKVESAAQLMFRVTDLSDPIEQGNETTYEIRVTNVGTRAATGIQLGAALSPALQPVSGTGPTAVAIQGQQVFFAPLERIAPRGEAIYKITAKGLQHGDHLIRVQVISNESPAPVTKEESTRVYQDQ
jgi:uncharacterized repeat protein (TIGR01451 family)